MIYLLFIYIKKLKENIFIMPKILEVEVILLLPGDAPLEGSVNCELPESTHRDSGYCSFVSNRSITNS